MMDDGARSLGFAQVSVPEGYDRFMLRQLFEPWAAELVNRAGIGPGDRVLDVASGLGPVARLAAAAAGPGGQVVASDISAAMLALAAARPADPRWAPVEYLQCPASAITAADDSFDVVLCQHGLDARWQTAEAATATLLGTPFGPLVSALPADAQEQVRARLASKLPGSADGVTVRTASNIACGVK